MSQSAEVGTPSSGTDANASGLARTSYGALFERYALVGLLVVVTVFFTLHPTTSEFFTTPVNVQNILANLAVTGILAVGMVVPLVAGYFDLSVSAVAASSNVVISALLCTHGAPIWISLVIGILIGPVIGSVVGYLGAILGLNPLIATLAVYTLLSGILLAYTGGATISNGFPAGLGSWGAAEWVALPRPFWVFLIVVVAAWYLLDLTPFGRRLAAIGASEPAARLAGINVRRMVFVAFLISGTLGALAGTILTIRLGSGNATTGFSYLFPALTAVFLGQTAIQPGRVNVWGTTVAVLLAAVVVNGLSLMGAQAWVEQVFNGGALLASLIVATLGVRARDRRASRAVLAAARAAAREPSKKEGADTSLA